MNLEKKMFETVMLIDDNRIDLILSQKVIENEQIARQVITFSKGEEAIAYLEKEKPLPSIIFVDVVMSDMNGLGFIQKFAELPATLTDGIRVYLVSASLLTQEQKEEALSHYKQVLFLSKPINKSIISKLK